MLRLYIGLFLLSAVFCQAQDYQFKKIVDNGPSSDYSMVSVLGIAPNGDILWGGALKSDGTTVLNITSGDKTTKVLDGTSILTSVQNGALNSSGTVLLKAYLKDNTQGLVVADKGGVRSLLTLQGLASTEAAPSLNESGTFAVASGTITPFGSVGAQIITGTPSGGQKVVADQATNFQAATLVGNPTINNLGELAFVSTTPTGGGLYFYSGGNFNLILPNSVFGQTFFATTSPPVLNDAGGIVFIAIDDQFFKPGVYYYRPGAAAPIITLGIGDYTFRKPVLNNAGIVAFYARVVSPFAEGLYTYYPNDTALTEVTQTGFAFLDSKLVSFDWRGTTEHYLDESGRLVFDYTLETGIQGIALAIPAPKIIVGSIANGATYLADGLVPGSWAQLKGYNFSAITRLWNDADFVGIGNGLPTKLDGVEVKVNGVSAAIYYISPTQITFQVPNVPVGPVIVEVIKDGTKSVAATSQIVARAPGVFPLYLNGSVYAAGVFLDGKITGSPTISSGFREAIPGDVIQMYATGLQASSAGIIPAPVSVPGVTVKLGDVTIPASSTTLVGVGLFQINFTVPPAFASLPAQNYPVQIQVGGVDSPASTSIPVKPK